MHQKYLSLHQEPALEFSLVVEVKKPPVLNRAMRAVRSPFSGPRLASEKFWSDVEEIRNRNTHRSFAVKSSPSPTDFERWLQDKFPAELLEKIKTHYQTARLRDEKNAEKLQEALTSLDVKLVAFNYGSLLPLLSITGIEALVAALGLSQNDVIQGFTKLLADFSPPLIAAQLGLPRDALSASANAMTASSSPASQPTSADLTTSWRALNASFLVPVLLVMGAAYVAFVVMQDQLRSMAEERKTFIAGVQTQVTALATERTEALAKFMTGKVEEAKLVLEAQKQATTQLAQEFENRQKLITAERESLAKLQAGLLDAQLQHIKDAGAGAKAREAAEADLYKTLLDRSKPPSPPVPAEPSCAGINDRLLAMKVQLALRERGLYSGPIDGDIGSGSRASLTAFQRSQGWEERGLRDKDTLAKLKIGC